MRIGLVARMDNSGLGYQTKALYKLLKPSKVLAIDSYPFNGRIQNLDWYEKPQLAHGFPTDADIDKFLKDLDVVITCEIPYNYTLFTLARERGIKTVLQPNAELNQHFRDSRLPKPDAFFLPSTWYADETAQLGVKTYLCPPPIDMNPIPKFKPKRLGHLEVLHFAGRRAAHDRNGTVLVKKIGHIPNVNITVHSQDLNDIPENEKIYDNGYDIVLIPRRYGGLCLPMYEALAHGYPVLMPDIAPNYDILPQEWLLRAERGLDIRTKRRVQTYKTNIVSMRDKLRWFRDMNTEDFAVQQSEARSIFMDYQAELNKWMEYLHEVANQ
jgi:hypothetical protein